MGSIRRYLLAALLGSMVVVMAAGGWATYRAARDQVAEIFDYNLKQIALSLRDQTFEGSAERLASDESLEFVIRVWDRNGLTVYYSRPHQSLPNVTQLGYADARTPDDDWRIYAIQYHGATIAVAQPMRVRRALAADAAWSTLKPFFVLLPVLGALIWVLVGRALAPLARIAKTLRARAPEALDPLPTASVPEEARTLVAALNDLFARQKMAMDAQRAFVADAAHELRTPLTALQLQAQLVERATDERMRASALEELKAGLQRTSHVVAQLLTLARQEPGATDAPLRDVELADLARQSVIAHQRIAQAAQVDLGIVGGAEEAHDPHDSPETDAEPDATAGERVRVCADPDALRVLLDNLIANAVRHTPPGGCVDVGFGRRAGRAYLEVADSGPGIPLAERERVFDRFYRRAGDDQNGSGLGLSIVRTIADRHGAQVSLGDSPHGGLRARVDFPRRSEQRNTSPLSRV